MARTKTIKPAHMGPVAKESGVGVIEMLSYL